MNGVVVVGSMNVDIALRAANIPRPGETVRASGMSIGAGGKGLNQAVAAARLGASVRMVGQVGADQFAQVPLSALADEGVDTRFVGTCAECATGTALIVVEEARGQNAITVAGGANGLLAPAQVLAAASAFEASKVLLVQLEAPEETVVAALVLAGAHGLTRILDPAPFRPLPDDLLARVDVLTPNESEASRLAGIDVHDTASAMRASEQLRKRTCGDVVITLGAAGCVWNSANEVQHLPAPDAECLDSTGAGDAFNGALAVGLANGEPMRRALELALAAGTASTRRAGAAASMPNLDEVEGLLGTAGA